MPDFISWFKQKVLSNFTHTEYDITSCSYVQLISNASISAELREVADGFAYRVSSFAGYDVNGHRFHTTRHEYSRPSRRTINTRVFTQGLDGVEYYGRIENSSFMVANL